jgi:hypothetical protein
VERTGAMGAARRGDREMPERGRRAPSPLPPPPRREYEPHLQEMSPGTSIRGTGQGGGGFLRPPQHADKALSRALDTGQASGGRYGAIPTSVSRVLPPDVQRSVSRDGPRRGREAHAFGASQQDTRGRFLEERGVPPGGDSFGRSSRHAGADRRAGRSRVLSPVNSLPPAPEPLRQRQDAVPDRYEVYQGWAQEPQPQPLDQARHPETYYPDPPAAANTSMSVSAIEAILKTTLQSTLERFHAHAAAVPPEAHSRVPATGPHHADLTRLIEGVVSSVTANARAAVAPVSNHHSDPIGPARGGAEYGRDGLLGPHDNMHVPREAADAYTPPVDMRFRGRYDDHDAQLPRKRVRMLSPQAHMPPLGAQEPAGGFRNVVPRAAVPNMSAGGYPGAHRKELGGGHRTVDAYDELQVQQQSRAAPLLSPESDALLPRAAARGADERGYRDHAVPARKRVPAPRGYAPDPHEPPALSRNSLSRRGPSPPPPPGPSQDRPYATARPARTRPSLEAPFVSPTPTLKLRSGGSRVADCRRSAHNARRSHQQNEDAFAVDYCSFAVGDGFEGKPSASNPGFNSAEFAQQLVTTATQFASQQLQQYVAEQGKHDALMPPVRVLQQATNVIRASGAAAVILGVLNPLTRVLHIGKLGDVGYVVLRPPLEGSSTDANQDLEVRLM